jgi:hypothetical protein
VGQEKIEQVRFLGAGYLLRQLMPQRTGKAQHPTLCVEVHLQTDTAYAGRLQGVLRR